MRILRRVWAETIWHPDALPPDEWKYRTLKRFWLPLYDLVALTAGLWAWTFGSPILHRLFHEEVVDVAGAVFALAALVCLAGITFPRLWRFELGGKITLVSLLGAYAFAVAVFRTNPDPSAAFVSFVLILAIPMPMFRLQLLGEEIKERDAEKVEEAGEA